jgi:hypothetical protein
MSIQNGNENRQIAHLHHLIEFELEKAQTEFFAVKKDLLGFILLIVGLCGLLVYIPLDIFLADLFPIGLIFLIGYTFFFIIASYHFIGIDNRNSSLIVFLLSHVNNPILREKISNFLNDSRNDDTIQILNVIYLISFSFFCIITFIYSISVLSYNPDVKPLYSCNIYIVILLIAQTIFIVWTFLKLNYSKENFSYHHKTSFWKFTYPAILLFICGIILLFYGNYSNIAPFSKIAINSTYSQVLIDSIQNHNEIEILIAIFSYFVIVVILVMDFATSKIISNRIYKKIQDLNKIKSKIDLFLIGKSENIDINEILIVYFKTRRVSFRTVTIGPFFWFYLPDLIISDDELKEFRNLYFTDEDLKLQDTDSRH